MAYVVARRGSYEIREAAATERGPRARTLATFAVLTDAVLDHAEARAGEALDRDELRLRARRVGAEVAVPAADAHAGALLDALSRGLRPTPVRARLLAAELVPSAVDRPDDHLRAAGEWTGASRERRGEALVDLLGLVDAMPPGRKRRTAVAKSLVDRVVAVHDALDARRTPHAIGGAVALAYYGEPRATVDVDLNVFVTVDQSEDVVAALAPLRLRDSVNLFFADDPFHDRMRERTVIVPFGDTTIPILSAEHLLVCKAVFNRAKDWLDIDQMLVGVPDLDGDEVRVWLERLVGRDDERWQRVDAALRELLGR